MKWTKGAWLRWLENRYLQMWLHGRGIEVGALSRPFPVPARARVWRLDRSSRDDLQQHYAEITKTIVKPDLLADATQFPFAPRSLDFIIVRHVFEHLPLPLDALRAWYEALAPRGLLLLQVPDKRYTFDARRARTSLDHLLDEHSHPERANSRDHYADWVENIGNRKPGTPAFDEAVQDLVDQKYSIHFHVWIDEDLREIVNFTRSAWQLAWQPVVFWRAHFFRKETTILLVRSAS
jgi:SAM-dependent methyltransferase